MYGRNQLPMTEELVPQPEDPYGIAKYAVELDLREAHEMFGLNSVIFRPHNVYGENQNIGDRYRNVIGIFMNQVMQGQPMTIFGDGKQTRAFSYIDDVAPVIAASIARPACYNQVFNVGADKPYSVLEVAQVVGRAMGADARHPASRRAQRSRSRLFVAREGATAFRRPGQERAAGSRRSPHGGLGEENRRPAGESL